MKTIAVLGMVGVIVYMVAWTISYVFFMGIDFRYFLEYFRRPWTSAGEIPAFINMVAIVLAVLMMLLFLLLWRWKKAL